VVDVLLDAAPNRSFRSIPRVPRSVRWRTGVDETMAIEPVLDHPEHGGKYAPLSDRPDQELAVFKRDDDPISCGRRHLARAPAGYPKDLPMHFGSAHIGRCA